MKMTSDKCVKRATAEAASETKISSFPRIRIKKGVEGEGRQGILFFIAGKNEHLGQAWAMVLFDDDDDPDTFKAACLEFVSGGGLPI